ncbi:type II secretion system protein GspG, partial [Mameliella sp. AT18]
MTVKLAKRNPRAGMSLLEVMVVLAIMALVIGIAAPRFIDSFGRAKGQSALIQMGNLRAAVQLFYIDMGRVPSPAEGLEALIRAPRGTTDWRGPYIDPPPLIGP